MDVFDRLYQACVTCGHEFYRHYTCYLLGQKGRKLFRGCGIEFVYPGDTYVPDEEVTMETRILKCPCRGFAESLQLSDDGTVVEASHA